VPLSDGDAVSCVEYAEDAYEQSERLMLVHRAVSADIDMNQCHHASSSSATLAKLSPPTKRTGSSFTGPAGSLG